MAVWKLTDAKCKSAKAAEKQYKLFDGEGLHLVVSPSGGKHWRVSYRVNGKAQTFSMGPWERIPLKDARQRLDVFRAELFDGKEIKKKVKTFVKVKTFIEVSAEYWATRKDCTASYVKSVERCFEKHVYPAFGKTPINQIDKSDVLDALLAIDAQGKTSQVKHSKIYCSQVFDYANAIGYVSSNPCKLIKSNAIFTKKVTVSRAAINEDEVPEFFAKLDKYSLTIAAQACRFLALTGLRTSEMRLLKWEHIKDDVAIIPAENMKMKKEHMVPLSFQALEILNNMKMQELNSEYVFANLSQLDAPVNPNVVLHLINKMGYQGKMTGHGWRSVFSTWANNRLYDSKVIETQLAHLVGNATSRAYNRAMYLPQRKQLLDDWANWLMPRAEGAQPLAA